MNWRKLRKGLHDLYSKYFSDDQISENEMDTACGTDGEERNL